MKKIKVRRKYNNGGNTAFGENLSGLSLAIPDNTANANLFGNSGLNSAVDTALPALDLLLPGLGTGLSFAKKGLESLGVFGESEEETNRKKALEEGKEVLSRNRSDSILSSFNTSGSSKSYLKYGGHLNKMSNSSAEVKGPSHEQGGVLLDSNIELEGGETINNNFVFSDELGFAKIHKPIAKAIGSIEERLESSPNDNISRDTLNLLKQKEDNLKIAQEEFKSNLGIRPENITKGAYGGLLTEPEPIKKFKKSQTFNNLKNSLLIDDDTHIRKNEFKNVVSDTLMVPDPLNPNTQIPYKEISDKLNDITYLNSISDKYPRELRTIQDVKKSIGSSYEKALADFVRKAGDSEESIIKFANGGPIKKGIDTSSSIDIDSLNSILGDKIKNITPQQIDIPSFGERLSGGLQEFGNGILPYASNILNATRTLPEVPSPILQPSSPSPKLVNYDSIINDSNRKARSLASEIRSEAPGIIGINNRAGILANNINEISKIKQGEENTNSQLINDNNRLNIGIQGSNTSLINEFNLNNLNRQLNQQRLQSENVADLSNKIQLEKRDRLLSDLELKKLEAIKKRFNPQLFDRLFNDIIKTN